MLGEVIANGDEITSGRILDTNSQWLSIRLEDLGIRVLYHTAVGDDMQAMVAVFRQAIDRSDVVVTTGGLGPTADDLTRQALANATGRQLMEFPAALEHIKHFFAERKREMPERNRVQASFPVGSEMLENPNGTAPGIAMEIPRPEGGICHFFCLPGVPGEVYEMWPQVEQRLRRLGAGHEYILHRDIKCFGAGESQVEAMLPNLIRPGNDPLVGINASKNTIILRISTKGRDRQECEAKIAPVVKTIYQCLGDLIFGEDEQELEDVVLARLARTKERLAVAEFDTAGMVTDWLYSADRHRNEDLFRGGMVLAANHLPSRLFTERGESPQSSQTAEQDDKQAANMVQRLAAHVRQTFEADVGLAVSPISPEESPRTFKITVAISSPHGSGRREIRFSSHPEYQRITVAKNMLNTLRLWLDGKLSLT